MNCRISMLACSQLMFVMIMLSLSLAASIVLLIIKLHAVRRSMIEGWSKCLRPAVELINHFGR